MCSDTCPCIDNPKSQMTLHGDKRLGMHDSKSTYESIPEERLNEYGRTTQNKSGYIPFNFTHDAKIGVITFE